MIILLAVSLIAGTLAAALGFSYYMDIIPSIQVHEKKEPTLIIEAETTKGIPLSMHVRVGNESGFTPFEFYGLGMQNVTLSNFDAFIFSQWDDGSGSRSRVIELDNNSTRTIKAIYQQAEAQVS